MNTILYFIFDIILVIAFDFLIACIARLILGKKTTVRAQFTEHSVRNAIIVGIVLGFGLIIFAYVK